MPDAKLFKNTSYSSINRYEKPIPILSKNLGDE